MKPKLFIKRVIGLCLCVSMGWPAAFCAEPAAQIPMAVSLTGGVQHLGVNYSFAVEENLNFQSVSLLMDLQGLSMGRVAYPGGMLRYDYHFALLSKSRMLLYAGPGAVAGYVADSDGRYGITLGLSGHFGMKYFLDRHIVLGVALHPVLGYNLNWENGHPKLNVYEAGLWRSILPEISVGYSLGNQSIGCARKAFAPAGQARTRRWTLGLEASYKPMVYNYLASMYLDNEGSRYYNLEDRATFYSNASMMLSAAWHFTEYYQLRMLLGYVGLRPELRVHALLLRNQWNFKPLNAKGDRFFAGIDAGIGLKTGDMGRPYALANLSFGYSLAVSADSSIEFFIRSGNAFGVPTLYEVGLPVPAERAFKSRLFVTSIDVGIAFDL